MTPPLVSVVIPTRNRKEFLQDALRSVVQQTYKNLQIIIHDNNSSDGTKEYIDELIQDPRVEYYVSNADLPMVENWNAAFSYVQGEYFVRLDDDNIYYPDFIESAVEQIHKHHLASISYASLIVHLEHRLQLLFMPTSDVHVLSPEESIYLEYFALTDSNYTVYSAAVIRGIFRNENAYQTTLPDRYMNYRIADSIDELHLRVGVTTAVKAITRFDYRPRISPDRSMFSFKNYLAVQPETVRSAMDCQDNFAMHRICTLWFFRDDVEDVRIREYIDSHLTSKKLYRTAMLMGEIAQMRIAYSFAEIRIMYQYAANVLEDLFRNTSERIEHKYAWVMIISFTRDILLRTGASIAVILTGKKRSGEIVDKGFGDAIVQRALRGEYVSTSGIRPIHGSLRALLDSIRVESRKTREATAQA